MEAWSHTLPVLLPRTHVSALIGKRICLSPPPKRLNHHFQSVAVLSFSVTPLVKRYLPSTGILTCNPSTTPLGLMLGSDLPWADSPGPGTLGFSVGGILTPLIATHFSISSCDTSSAPYRYTFVSIHNALLPLIAEFMASVRHLSPVTFSAQNH